LRGCPSCSLYSLAHFTHLAGPSIPWSLGASNGSAACNGARRRPVGRRTHGYLPRCWYCAYFVCCTRYSPCRAWYSLECAAWCLGAPSGNAECNGAPRRPDGWRAHDHLPRCWYCAYFVWAWYSLECAAWCLGAPSGNAECNGARVGLMAGERMAICPGASIALVLFAAYATHLAGAGTSWSALLGASGHQAVTPHATASLVMQRLRCECSSPPRRHDDRFLPPAPSAL
jgi:hypothetical protein